MNQNNFQRMEELFKSADITLTNNQLQKFWDLARLLEEYNDEYDLTRIRKFDDVVIKHFIDSILVTRYHQLPSSLVDIGTGAGFPGMPLKIITPDLHLVLAEPRHKRIEFMNMLIKKFNFENVSTHQHKVDENSFFQVNGVITRAFENIEATLSRVDHFLPEGGEVIFMKGPNVGADFARLSKENKRIFSLEVNQEYVIPYTTHERSLVVFKKKNNFMSIPYTGKMDENYMRIEAISSTENKFYKETKKLTTVQGIKKLKKCIISGKKIVLETYKKFDFNELSLIIAEDYRENDQEINNLIKKFYDSKKLVVLKKSLFNEIDTLNIGSPLLIAPTKKIEDWNPAENKGITLLLPFQDPTNIGSIIRTALAFSVDKIVLLQEAANPFNLKAIRSSSGTIFSAPLFRGPSIHKIKDIIENNQLKLVSLDSQGTPLRKYEFSDNLLLLPGIEGPGLPEEFKQDSVAIEIDSQVESLNASVATAIVLYQWKSKI